MIEEVGRIPNRKSLRLPGFNYSAHGAYFITICTRDRVPLLGGFDHESLRLSAAGEMMERWWWQLPNKF